MQTPVRSVLIVHMCIFSASVAHFMENFYAYMCTVAIAHCLLGLGVHLWECSGDLLLEWQELWQLHLYMQKRKSRPGCSWLACLALPFYLVTKLLSTNTQGKMDKFLCWFVVPVKNNCMLWGFKYNGRFFSSSAGVVIKYSPLVWESRQESLRHVQVLLALKALNYLIW